MLKTLTLAGIAGALALGTFAPKADAYCVSLFGKYGKSAKTGTDHTSKIAGLIDKLEGNQKVAARFLACNVGRMVHTLHEVWGAQGKAGIGASHLIRRWARHFILSFLVNGKTFNNGAGKHLSQHAHTFGEKLGQVFTAAGLKATGFRPLLWKNFKLIRDTAKKIAAGTTKWVKGLGAKLLANFGPSLKAIVAKLWKGLKAAAAKLPKLHGTGFISSMSKQQ
jgi:hypothetical protein